MAECWGIYRDIPGGRVWWVGPADFGGLFGDEWDPDPRRARVYDRRNDARLVASTIGRGLGVARRSEEATT